MFTCNVYIIQHFLNGNQFFNLKLNFLKCKNKMDYKNDENNKITFYISIISGILLTVSETLPYIKNIKSNGIIELLVNFVVKKSLTTQSTTSAVNISTNERTPLLSEVSSILISSPNITVTFNSPNTIVTKTNDSV